MTGLPSGEREIKSRRLTAVRELSCLREEMEEKEKVRPCSAGNLVIIRWLLFTDI